jgi:adenine/guanine phosphoribosyltransferase-like PRPP-binding protein
LEKYRSTREFYFSLKTDLDLNAERKLSYSQFTRYLKGESKLNKEKLNFFRSYLLEKINIVPDLVIPRIDIDIQAQPIQIDLTELLSSPPALNFLAYFFCLKEHLYDRFDVILTHSEAVPLAIGFSQALDIPWYSVAYRPPTGNPEQITQYPYLIDQEHVSTLYFLEKKLGLRNKRVLIINDYVRKGGLLDILFRVVEDNFGEVSYLFALIGIGSLWKSLFTELSGRIKVIYLLSQ